jgi:hypothetical protein
MCADLARRPKPELCSKKKGSFELFWLRSTRRHRVAARARDSRHCPDSFDGGALGGDAGVVQGSPLGWASTSQEGTSWVGQLDIYGGGVWRAGDRHCSLWQVIYAAVRSADRQDILDSLITK